MTISLSYTIFNGQVVKENRGGVERYYAPDTLGSTAQLLDGSGNVTDTYTYWPYGEIRSHIGTSTTPLTFVGTLGYYLDLVASWFYVRARHFQQTVGRWLTVDPIWPREPTYAYVMGIPLLATDPTGLGDDYSFSLGGFLRFCGRHIMSGAEAVYKGAAKGCSAVNQYCLLLGQDFRAPQLLKGPPFLWTCPDTPGCNAMCTNYNGLIFVGTTFLGDCFACCYESLQIIANPNGYDAAVKGCISGCLTGITVRPPATPPCKCQK